MRFTPNTGSSETDALDQERMSFEDFLRDVEPALDPRNLHELDPAELWALLEEQAICRYFDEHVPLYSEYTDEI
jgi:hypothetical protein